MPPPSQTFARRRIRRNADAREMAPIVVGSAYVSKPGAALINTYDDLPETEAAAATLQTGKPLCVEYRRFQLNLASATDADAKILVTTQLRTKPDKKVASEHVTFFDPQAGNRPSTYEVEDWGGHFQGHPLIYYTQSYLGEPLMLSTSVWELDRSDGFYSALQAGLSKAKGIPLFLDFVPYLGAASVVATLFQKLQKVLNRDDAVITPEALDLRAVKEGSVRKLRKGRYVVAVGISDEDLVAKYRLRNNNRLEDTSGKEVTDRSYYVFEVVAPSEPLEGYETFDHAAGAAEILALVNRPQSVEGTIADAIDVMTTAFGAASNVDTLARLRKSVERAMDGDEAALRRVADLKQKLDPDLVSLIEPWLKRRLPAPDPG